MIENISNQQPTDGFGVNLVRDTAKRPPENDFLFGAYLIEQRIIKREQLEEAIRFQKQRQLFLGELGIKQGYFQTADVNKILDIQQRQGGKFGEIAVDQGLISREQLQALLEAQSNNHFYLGEALLALGYIINQDELYRYLANFKAFTKPGQLIVEETLWQGFDREVLQQIIRLTFEFFYSEGYVVQLAEVTETLPLSDRYVVYSVEHTFGKKGLFKGKANHALSFLLLSTWNRLIGRNRAHNTPSDAHSDDVAQAILNFNDLLSRRLRKLDYHCKHGPIRLTIPAFNRRLTIRFDTSVEPLYLLYTKNM